MAELTGQADDQGTGVELRQRASNVDDRVGHDQEATTRANRMLEVWLQADWRPWAMAAQPALHARRLYEELYDLRLRLQREEALTELVWGHGVLGWQVGDERVLHPLVTSRMLVRFDPDSGEIAVVPEGEGQLNLEIEILQR